MEGEKVDVRQLNLDCDQSSPDDWRVFCRNTGLVLSENQPSAEHAWAVAAERLASSISDIRRSVCDLD